MLFCFNRITIKAVTLVAGFDMFSIAVLAVGFFTATAVNLYAVAFALTIVAISAAKKMAVIGLDALCVLLKLLSPQPITKNAILCLTTKMLFRFCSLKKSKRKSANLSPVSMSKIKAYDMELDTVKENLRYVFGLLEDCGKAYKHADDQIRRCLNQALFKKIFMHDDLSLFVEYNAPFEVFVSPSALYLAANNKGNEVLPDQKSLFARILQAHSTIEEIEEAEIVKQNEQHWCAAHFGITSQNYNFFDKDLSKDNLLQSGKKRSEQPDLQNRPAHPIKTTQTTDFFVRV